MTINSLSVPTVEEIDKATCRPNGPVYHYCTRACRSADIALKLAVISDYVLLSSGWSSHEDLTNDEVCEYCGINLTDDDY